MQHNINIVINKETAISFTGYRPEKIAQSINRPNLVAEIYSEVYNAIKNLYNQGYTTFLSGMAEGFDMIAAEAVLALKKEACDMKLIAVIPYMGQELRYSDMNKARYKTNYDNADKVVFTSYSRDERCFLNRNDYLLANCTTLVCYYSGQRGGTMYTFNRERRVNLQIINIFNTIATKEDA